MLKITPDRWTHSSDYFELMIEMCEKLLRSGKAYVDDTDTETMRKEREERFDSKNRNSCEWPLQAWIPFVMPCTVHSCYNAHSTPD